MRRKSKATQTHRVPKASSVAPHPEHPRWSEDELRHIPPLLWETVSERIQTHAAAKPFVIGLAGRSGAGKTTLAKSLARELRSNGHEALLLGVDDFFKHPDERRLLGEWSPEHVRIDEARRVLAEIVDRSPAIETLKYSRLPAKDLYPWTIDASGVSVVLFEGLYAISSEKRLGAFVDFADLAVFLRATDEDSRRWRFQQEEEKPVSKSRAEMEKHWTEGIEPDTAQNVLPSEANAEIVIEVNAERQLTVVV